MSKVRCELPNSEAILSYYYSGMAWDAWVQEGSNHVLSPPMHAERAFTLCASTLRAPTLHAPTLCAHTQ